LGISDQTDSEAHTLGQPQSEWQAAVKLPKARKTHTALAIGIAATATLVILGPGSTAAMAGRMIGSAGIINNSIQSGDIRNDTVQSGDVRNNSIQGADVRNGTLTSADFSGTMRGATGPQGPAGPAGPPGTAGSDGASPTTIKDWNIHNDAAAPDGFGVTSSDNVPADTQVTVVKLTFPALPGCDEGSAIVQTSRGQTLGTAGWTSGQGWSAASLSGGGFIVSQAAPLTARVNCNEAFMGPRQAVPAFDATVTLALTDWSAPATSAFN
jgi:hypothetical protein